MNDIATSATRRNEALVTAKEILVDAERIATEMEGSLQEFGRFWLNSFGERKVTADPAKVILQF